MSITGILIARVVAAAQGTAVEDFTSIELLTPATSVLASIVQTADDVSGVPKIVGLVQNSGTCSTP